MENFQSKARRIPTKGFQWAALQGFRRLTLEIVEFKWISSVFFLEIAFPRIEFGLTIAPMAFEAQSFVNGSHKEIKKLNSRPMTNMRQSERWVMRDAEVFRSTIKR